MRSYLIAITPPEKICQIVDRYRMRYGSRATSNIPPHITIHQSFSLERISESDLIKIVGHVADRHHLHRVEIVGVSYFEGKNNVLYFKPDSATQEFTKNLFIDLSGVLSAKIRNRHLDFIVIAENFSAHMTIADKIPNDAFEIIKKAPISILEAIFFDVSSIDLYYQEANSSIYKLLKTVHLKL